MLCSFSRHHHNISRSSSLSTGRVDGHVQPCCSLKRVTTSELLLRVKEERCVRGAVVDDPLWDSSFTTNSLETAVSQLALDILLLPVTWRWD